MTRFSPQGGGPRERGQAPRPQVPALSREDAQKIVQGDTELLVERARQVAGNLKGEASRSQLRRLYGEVKRIEMMWRGGKANEAQRRVVLLKPRLAYQVARQRELEGLRATLEPAIDAVGPDRERFQRFVEFFEAIVAYAR